jgi:hypothetical protein
MLWFAGKVRVDRKLLVSAACACARIALQYVASGELRPLRAIEAAESWCRGESTEGQVREAAYPAYAIDAYAAYAAAATAAYSAYADAAAAVKMRTLAECADIVRRMIPFAEVDQ